MLKWLSFGLLFCSCVHIQGRGFSLLFGHSSVMDLGRQVEHMAAPPMTGGLLLWKRDCCQVLLPRNLMIF